MTERNSSIIATASTLLFVGLVSFVLVWCSGCVITVRHEIVLKRPDWLPQRSPSSQPTDSDMQTPEEILEEIINGGRP